MNLHRATVDEYKVIRALYVSAFPRNERAPFYFIKRRAFQERAEMLVATENDELIGFAYTVQYKALVYLFYFAVAKDKRGRGYGSKILDLLKDFYKDNTIFLAREPLDDTAKNSQDRIRRQSFYLQNGWIDLPYQIREANVIYDLMSTGKVITAADYNTLIQNWAGKFVARILHMRFIE